MRDLRSKLMWPASPRFTNALPNRLREARDAGERHPRIGLARDQHRRHAETARVERAGKRETCPGSPARRTARRRRRRQSRPCCNRVRGREAAEAMRGENERPAHAAPAVSASDLRPRVELRRIPVVLLDALRSRELPFEPRLPVRALAAVQTRHGDEPRRPGRMCCMKACRTLAAGIRVSDCPAGDAAGEPSFCDLVIGRCGKARGPMLAAWKSARPCANARDSRRKRRMKPIRTGVRPMPQASSKRPSVAAVHRAFPVIRLATHAPSDRMKILLYMPHADAAALAARLRPRAARSRSARMATGRHRSRRFRGRLARAARVAREPRRI